MSEDYDGLVKRLREMAEHGGASSRLATMRAAASALSSLCERVEALEAGKLPQDWLAMHAADKRLNDELRQALAAMTTERDELLAAHRQRDIVDLALEEQHTQADAQIEFIDACAAQQAGIAAQNAEFEQLRQALALAQAERKQARALLARCPEAVRLALSYIESRLDDSYWNRMVALDADLRAALGEKETR